MLRLNRNATQPVITTAIRTAWTVGHQNGVYAAFFGAAHTAPPTRTV